MNITENATKSSAASAITTSAVLKGWMPSLDGIRGLAILMVMAEHFGLLLDRHSVVNRLAGTIFDLGWTGVDLFFVLSGFLITGILVNSRDAENYFSSFYMRRMLRIFPVYYSSLAFLFLLFPILFPGEMQTLPVGLERVGYFVYAQNWHIPSHWRLTNPYWSLAVEEQFYLIWPWVIARFSLKRVLQISVGASIVSLALRSVLLTAGISPVSLYANTLTRMDSLLIGSACAILLRDERIVPILRRNAQWLAAAPVATLVVLRIAGRGASPNAMVTEGIGYTAIALSYAGLLVSVVVTMGNRTLIQRFFGSRMMRAVGRYSYAAYVWHMTVGLVVSKLEIAWFHKSLSPSANLPIMIASTLAVSMVSYALLERPTLRLKTYFEPRRAHPESLTMAAGVPAH